MLRPIQQELVSALVNLGMKMKEAEPLVTEVTRGREGLGFDELFRLCLPPKQERRAAA
jgi:Holliday junction resolvasome RuvABC DNA-binding subunit